MRFCFQLGVAAIAFMAFGASSRAAETGKTRTTVRSARAVPVARVDPRSRQQVRTIVVTPAVMARKRSAAASAQDAASPLLASLSTGPNLRNLVEEAAQEYNVNPALIDSVIQVESNYNPYAVSPKGARGLMQLMPDTARRFGVRNTFDPRENINGGVKYLKFLQDTFKDDRLAIAAYNAGEGAVSKYNNVPPYPETISYVTRVGKRYGKGRKAAEPKPVPPAAAQAEKPPAPEYLPVRQYVDADGRIHLTTD